MAFGLVAACRCMKHGSAENFDNWMSVLWWGGMVTTFVEAPHVFHRAIFGKQGKCGCSLLGRLTLDNRGRKPDIQTWSERYVIWIHVGLCHLGSSTLVFVIRSIEFLKVFGDSFLWNNHVEKLWVASLWSFIVAFGANGGGKCFETKYNYVTSWALSSISVDRVGEGSP